MKRSIRPVVYVASTLARETVQQLLPDAILRESVQRGDLYRDRALGYSVFLIIDGVFLQQQAVSPREVIDVIEDGAMVAGASSMGALRAAECWPCGMRGVGSIYRLYRSGALRSDDEVVVTFNPFDGRPLSLPLVNVRYALSRLVKSGRIPLRTGLDLVAAAQGLFFTERTWETIFERARPDIRLEDVLLQLEGLDLKRKDALRAIGRLKMWIHDPEGLKLKPSRGIAAMIPTELRREPDMEQETIVPAVDHRSEWICWLLAAGFCRKSCDTMPRAPLALLHEIACEGRVEAALDLWQRLEIEGEDLTLAMRREAIELAKAWAEDRSLRPAEAELAQAGLRMARRHGLHTWQHLLVAVPGVCCARHLETCRQLLGYAELAREHWTRQR